MGFFGAAHGWGGGFFGPPLHKICHTYPTVMKLGTVIPYLRKIQKMYESRDNENYKSVSYPCVSIDYVSIMLFISKNILSGSLVLSFLTRINHLIGLLKTLPEAATRGVLQKVVFLKIFKNLQENTCARAFFWSQAILLKRRTWDLCLSVCFMKFLRAPFLQNTSRRPLLHCQTSKLDRFVKIVHFFKNLLPVKCEITKINQKILIHFGLFLKMKNRVAIQSEK